MPKRLSTRKTGTGYRKRYRTIRAARKSRSHPVRRRRLGKFNRVRRRSSTRSSRGGSRGGYLDKSSTFVSGRSTHLSNAFKSRCVQAVTPTYIQCFDGYSTGSCFQSQCAYMYPAPTFDQYQTFILANLAFNGSPNVSMNFTVHSLEAVYKICNTNNVSANIRLYYCEPRHDIPYYGQNTAATPFQQSINSIVAQGWTDMQNASFATDISATLFMNQNFVSRFKVLKTSMMKLIAGETRTVTIKQPSTRNINYSRWANAGTPQIYLAQGLTKFLVVQYWGMPVQLATNASIVGMASLQMEVVSTLKYYVSAPARTAAHIFNTATPFDGGGNQFSLNTTGTMDVVVEQTGVNTIAF